MVGVFCLHPVSKVEPAVIRFSGKMNKDLPVLNILAAAHAAGDMILSVRTNGVELKSWVLNGTQGATLLSVSLPHPERIDSLTIANIAGGKNDWYFEHAFIGRIWFSRENR